MVRPEALWCSLCFARFDQAEEPHPLGELLGDETTSGEPQPTPLDPLTAPLDPLTAPLDPLTAPLDPLTAPLDQLIVGADPAAAGAALPAAADPGHAEVPSVAPPHPLEGPEVEGVDVDEMLALLAAESRQQDTLGTWGERLSDRTTRFLVMAGGVVVLSIALFAVLGVLSLLA